METCWTSGADLLLTEDKAGRFWCLFLCWFSFPRGLDPGRVVPSAAHRSQMTASKQLSDLRPKPSWKFKKVTKVDKGLLLQSLQTRERGRIFLQKAARTKAAKQEGNIQSSPHLSTPGSESLNKTHTRAPRLPPLSQTHFKDTADVSGHKAYDKGIEYRHRITWRY